MGLRRTIFRKRKEMGMEGNGDGYEEFTWSGQGARSGKFGIGKVSHSLIMNYDRCFRYCS